jgi:uncharacterized 2Fe-2S/4Fe-4S cluster protein (DUF4445 family)
VKKHLVVFEPSGLRLSMDEQSSFLQSIREAGLHVSSQCGGQGTCGKCHILLHQAPDPKDSDLKFLSSIEIENGYRLACQHTVNQDTRVILPSQKNEVKIVLEGKTVTQVWNLDSSEKDQIGVAIDLGTTTIVAYLLNLGTGVQLGQVAGLNPQVVYGEDVVTRITSAVNEEGGQEKLSEIVTKEIDALINRLLEKTKSKREEITQVSIVGNTAMHHLLLKADVKSLGLAPYEPSIRDAVNRTTEDIGLASVANAYTYLPPNIAGFVGGDTVGFILAQRLDLTEDVILGIDIGTNGEIVLANQGKLSCCSAAAGSAFEGATIHNGMRGKTGAIEYVSIENPDEPPEISVIGGTTPQGICGSGIVDMVAEMVRTEIVDSSGKLQTDSNRVFENSDGELGYLISSSEESGAERDIVFTQKDVRQVQLAKGAIFTGSTILLEESGLDVQDVDMIMLAGAFGSYISPESALSIGLFPNVGVERVVQVGNAAGEGAKILLLSTQARAHVNSLIPKIEYLELANHQEFQSIFINSLKFPDQ